MANYGQFRVKLPDKDGKLVEVLVSGQAFFACSEFVTEVEANGLYRDGGTFLHIGPSGDIVDVLINKRTSEMIIGRFPEGSRAAKLTDLLKETAKPGSFKKRAKKKVPTDATKADTKLQEDYDILVEELGTVRTELDDALAVPKLDEVAIKGVTALIDIVEEHFAPEDFEDADLSNLQFLKNLVDYDKEPDYKDSIAFPEAPEIGDEFEDAATKDVYIFRESMLKDEEPTWVLKEDEGGEANNTEPGPEATGAKESKEK